MKTLFDPSVREELIGRIHSLHTGSQAVWGKMNVYQMTRHCTIWDDWVQGIQHPPYQQIFLGKIFGRAALKRDTKDARPLPKGVPTGKYFTVKENGDVENQKRTWASRVASWGSYSNPAFIHDFYGKMTEEQIGVFAYKHYDHHLRQFGV